MLDLKREYLILYWGNSLLVDCVGTVGEKDLFLLGESSQSPQGDLAFHVKMHSSKLFKSMSIKESFLTWPYCHVSIASIAREHHSSQEVSLAKIPKH